MANQSRITPSPVDILCLGDSQTLLYTSGLGADKFWASQLQIQGIAAGYSLNTINCGNSGWTTAQLYDIAAGRIQRYAPPVLILYAGVNDTSGSLVPSSIVCSGTTATVTLAISTMPYNEGQLLTVTNASQSAVNVSGAAIHITGANTFTYTMGSSFTGTATANASTSLTVTSPFTGAKTQGYIQSILDVAFANGVQYAFVMNTNYLNYSASQGDNAGAGTYYNTYATLRTFQAAAVTTWQAANPTLSSKVALCDLFTYQKNLVLAGTSGWVQGTFGSHIANVNQHMNAVGHSATATKVLEDIIASGAITAYKVQSR